MKTGYDQFFKQVRKQVEKKAEAKPERKVHPRPRAPVAKRRSKSPGIPFQLVGLLIVGLGFSILGLLAPQSFDKLTSVVEVQLFGPAVAAEPEAKPAGADPAKAEKSADGKDAKEVKSEKPASGKVEWTQEEMSFFSKLNERKKELDQREVELNKLEEELQQQKVALDKRLKQLEQMRGQIADTLKTQVEVDKEKVDKLVEFYSNMKPQQAAKIMESLNEDLAVETLTRMKKKNAAEIMNLLDAKKAQSISEKFAGYRHN